MFARYSQSVLGLVGPHLSLFKVETYIQTSRFIAFTSYSFNLISITPSHLSLEIPGRKAGIVP